MKLAENDLRVALREVADATPVAERWDRIEDASPRRLRSRVVVGGSTFLAAATIVAVVALALGSTTPKFTVTAGAPRTDAVSVFPHGPSVALGKLSHGRLAFVSDSDLYVADADTQTVRRLTHSGDASAFAWSADGEWLAFSVRDAPGYEDYTTWVTRADGRDAHELARMSGVYAWSPRGHQLAIAGFCCTDSQRGGVYVVDAGTGTRRVVAPGSEVPTIAWAPDGRTLGYTSAPISGDLSRAGVWTVAGRGGTPRRVTDGLLVMWSPDARSLLVNGRNDLALVGIDGGDRRRLTSTANLGGDYPSTWAAFSPDGDAIAVVGNGANTLVVCRSDGSSCANVAGVHAPPIAGLSFSPDGKRITYVADGALWIVDGDSADAQVHQAELAPRRLDDLGRDLLQGAGDGVHITRGTAPNAPVWLGDGTILYHHGAQLRVVDPDGGPSTTIANPIGFSDAGAKDQGLPGGQPIAEWQLTTRPS